MASLKWNESEVKYLRDKWGEISIARIAKKLGRTVNAVKIKARREGLTSTLNNLDGITLNQLAIIFSVSYGWTIKKLWIDQFELPYKTKVTAQTKAYRYICLDDFWKWAKKYKHRINFSKLERNILGKEPSWVPGKRKADRDNLTYKKSNIPWSKNEEAFLKEMLKMYKYTYSEMSDKLERTEGAIKKHIEDLGWLERPLRTDWHRKWIDEDIEILIEMKNIGYGNSSISKKVGRTARAVEGKLERISRNPKWMYKLEKHLQRGELCNDNEKDKE